MSEPHRNWTKRACLPSHQGAHLACMREILEQLGRFGWDGRDLFGIEMALEESLSNAIRHGNRFDDRKVVHVDCQITPERFWIRVEDEGAGFCPECVPDCTAEENLERSGGRGLALIQAFMTRVEYNDCGNCVTMEKIRSQPAP